MPNKKTRVFELDRKMELRLRLAAKKALEDVEEEELEEEMLQLPARELVDRLIERVRRL